MVNVGRGLDTMADITTSVGRSADSGVDIVRTSSQMTNINGSTGSLSMSAGDLTTLGRQANDNSDAAFTIKPRTAEPEEIEAADIFTPAARTNSQEVSSAPATARVAHNTSEPSSMDNLNMSDDDVPVPTTPALTLEEVAKINGAVYGPLMALGFMGGVSAITLGVLAANGALSGPTGSSRSLQGV